MLSEIEQRIVRELGKDIPLCSQPFKLISERLGIGEEELLIHISKMQEDGIIRRMGAILNHNKAGFTSNAMVVWDIDDNRVDSVGELLSEMREISHCYKRKRNEGWGFNLYTMLHGKTREECHEIVRRIVHMISPKDYRILFTVKEMKKIAMQYFY